MPIIQSNPGKSHKTVIHLPPTKAVCRDMNCLIDLKEMSLLESEIIRVVVDPYSAGENIGMISSASHTMVLVDE